MAENVAIKSALTRIGFIGPTDFILGQFRFWEKFEF